MVVLVYLKHVLPVGGSYTVTDREDNNGGALDGL